MVRVRVSARARAAVPVAYGARCLAAGPLASETTVTLTLLLTLNVYNTAPRKLHTSRLN